MRRSNPQRRQLERRRPAARRRCPDQLKLSVHRQRLLQRLQRSLQWRRRSLLFQFVLKLVRRRLNLVLLELVFGGRVELELLEFKLIRCCSTTVWVLVWWTSPSCSQCLNQIGKDLQHRRKNNNLRPPSLYTHICNLIFLKV